MSPEKFKKKRFVEYVEQLPKTTFEQAKIHENPIIFDTNFLFTTFEFPIDVVGEIRRLVGTNYSLFIYEGTLAELQAIEDKKDKNKKFLPLIATMLKTFNFKVIQSNTNYVDEHILRDAKQTPLLVATNDAALRKELWSIPCRVLYMRQKQYLEIA